MRGTAVRPPLRRRTGPFAGVAAGVVALGVLAGCGGAPDPGAAVGATPLAASANPSPLSIGWGLKDYAALLSTAIAKSS